MFAQVVKDSSEIAGYKGLLSNTILMESLLRISSATKQLVFTISSSFVLVKRLTALAESLTKCKERLQRALFDKNNGKKLNDVEISRWLL